MKEQERQRLDDLAKQVAQLNGRLDVYTLVIGTLIGQLSQSGAIRAEDIRSALVMGYAHLPKGDPALETVSALLAALPR